MSDTNPTAAPAPDLAALVKQFTDQLNASAQRFQDQANAALAGVRNPAAGPAPAAGSMTDFELFLRVLNDPALKAKVQALVQEARPSASASG
jgi:hypothetical protein